MNITRDTLGHLENPNLILTKASRERVGVLSCTSKVWVKKYNDMDTMSFEMPYISDGKDTPFYDMIDIMKYIEVPSLGAAFAIKDVGIVNEGQKTEYKKVECQSRECELGQKYLQEFEINTGTVGALDGIKFYQPGDQTHSLLNLILEKLPGWSIGHVDAGLYTMQRSFEITRQDVYSFLMSDVMNAFECVITFDSLNRNINAYKIENYGKDINIHVSYNNLLENTDMDYSVDQVKTALVLHGEDELDVRELCMGNDTIYNFSYYASEEYMSSSLLNAYNAWMNLLDTAVDLNLFTYETGVITRAELQGKTYKQAFTLLLQKYQNYYTQISKWTSTLLPYGINTRKNPGYGTISYTEDGSDKIIFERQTSTQLVNSLPSHGSGETLYLIKGSNDMYRWNGSWVNVNKWYNCCLNELKTLLASAERLQAVAMKAGYGDPDSTSSSIQARYVDTYLPSLYMYNALRAQIETVKPTIAELQRKQGVIQTDKTVVVNKTAMRNNFTVAQLRELSAFIREDELSSSNFLVTDSMTEDDRFEMLYALLEFGEKELAKVAAPQIQFSAGLVNLFAIPEFDKYSGDFDVGNYVWVTLRDDYSLKVKILEISIDFLDQSNFSVTFGNVMKKARNIFTDVTDALNAATSAATSVSFNSSYWSAAAEDTDTIGKALEDGLLSQSYYLANAEDNETLIDDAGVWITTTTGEHGRENTEDYDAIYLGGGRILYTDDGWRTVAMSVGRGDVQMPSINSQGQMIFTTESRFGVFADFLIAGYVGGSMIVGGDIYSANYKTSSSKTSGNAGVHINLTDGTFELNDKTSGRKRLILSGDELEVNGIIHAREGHIGSDVNGNGGFVIQSNKLYNNKDTFNGTGNGVYIGTDGISLGAYSNGKNPFSVTNSGYLVSKSGTIGGWDITADTLKSGNLTLSSSGNDAASRRIQVKVGNDDKFYVTNGGKLYAKDAEITGAITATSGTIGGWTINSGSLSSSGMTLNATDGKLSIVSNSKTIFEAATDGIVWNATNSTMTKDGVLTIEGNGVIKGSSISGSTISGGAITGSTITGATIQTAEAGTDSNPNPRILMDSTATLKGLYGSSPVNYIDMAQENATDGKYHMNIIAKNALNIMTPLLTVGTNTTGRETTKTKTGKNKRLSNVRKIYYNPSEPDPVVTQYKKDTGIDLYDFMKEGYVPFYSRSGEAPNYNYALDGYVNCQLPVMLVLFGDDENIIHGMVTTNESFKPEVRT